MATQCGRGPKHRGGLRHIPPIYVSRHSAAPRAPTPNRVCGCGSGSLTTGAWERHRGGGAVAVCFESCCGSMCWPVDRPATHAAAGAAARGVRGIGGILSHAQERRHEGVSSGLRAASGEDGTRGLLRKNQFPAGARNKSSLERPRGSSTASPHVRRPPFCKRSCRRQSHSPPPCWSRIFK